MLQGSKSASCAASPTHAPAESAKAAAETAETAAASSAAHQEHKEYEGKHPPALSGAQEQGHDNKEHDQREDAAPLFCRDTGCRRVCGAPVRETPASFAMIDDTATIALDRPLS